MHACVCIHETRHSRGSVSASFTAYVCTCMCARVNVYTAVRKCPCLGVSRTRTRVHLCRVHSHTKSAHTCTLFRQPISSQGSRVQTTSLAKWLRRPTRERKIPGSNSACARIFPGSSHTSHFKIGTPVASLPGAWRYRVSAGTGRPSVSIL